jgi:cellulose biosynthesis protein BcsQ
MTLQPLQQALINLPDNAQESLINNILMPEFLNSLGFSTMECVPQFVTSKGACAVDYATRRNTEDDVFTTTQSNPYLLIELKSKNINLTENSAPYKQYVRQLKQYLLGENCQAAQWGILTNSIHLYLFRKHGKVIYPAAPCMTLTPNNIVQVIKEVRKRIENPSKALTIAVYNNKGGVGQTTTTLNLAAVLGMMGKKALIIDFDPNQRDLSNSLGVQSGETTLYSCLNAKKDTINIKDAIIAYKLKNITLNKERNLFDLIPADKELADLGENDLLKQFKISRLSQVLNSLKSKYDYILIDSSPNWRFFSQSALYAADVVLIPTKHNNIFSLENAAEAIVKFIPEIQQFKKDGSPVALPIFFNGEKKTDAQINIANQAISNLIKRWKQEYGFDLVPYFYPQYSTAKENKHIFELPSYANIAGATFARTPAACKDRTARDYYIGLAKEYFLQ